MMKGDMELEYPFKIFLYIVILLVVISFVIHFKDEILSYLNLCQFLPQGCQQAVCSTDEVKESVVDEAKLIKYCDDCWRKTGEGNYNEDCLCSIVKGNFSPIPGFKHDNCELKCDKETSSIILNYNHYLKTVYIEC